MKLPEFKHKISFASILKPQKIEGEAKEKISLAALDELKKIIPESVYGQSDILPVAFDACNVNIGNHNHEAIDTEVAIDIYKSFIHKPINSEHVRPDIIGHIVSAGFSKFDPEYLKGSNTELIDEEYIIENYLDNNGVFNICLGGVLYILVDTDLCSAIYDSGDSESANYLKYSASWELGFSDYVFAVGSFKLAECEIIEDEKRMEEYAQYAKFNGGSGFLPDGRPLIRWIYGSVHPLGIGITETQAGRVKGIVSDFKTAQEEEGMKGEEEKKNEKEESEDSKAEKVIISQQESNAVTINKEEKTQEKIIMKRNIKTVEEFRALNDEEIAEVSVASLKEILETELKKISEEYAKKIEEESRARETAIQANEDNMKKITELSEKLAKIEEEQTRAAIEQKFNERMTLLDEKFNLGDAEREIVVAEIKNLDDEAFENWYKRFSVLAKTLAKDFVDPEKKDLTDKLESKETEIEQLKKASNTSTASIPNSVSGDVPLKERLEKSFRENFKIEV